MINLNLGDCVEAMANMEDNAYDLAIVDPPYGIKVEQQRLKSERKTAKWKNPKEYKYRCFEDFEIPEYNYFEQLKRVSKNQIIWGANYMTKHLPPSMGWVVWDKKADIKEHISMCELAYTSFNRKCNKFEFLWAGFRKAQQEKRIHPTQKPVALYKWLLKNYANEGDKILDTHLGSGSIAIACYDGGFSLDAWEIDEEYHAAAVKRYNTHISQLRLL